MSGTNTCYGSAWLYTSRVRAYRISLPSHSPSLLMISPAFYILYGYMLAQREKSRRKSTKGRLITAQKSSSSNILRTAQEEIGYLR